MEKNRILPVEPKITLHLDNNIFGFAKKLKVGDKGVLQFNGVVKSHYAKQYDDEESKNIQLLNLKLHQSKRII